MQIAVCDDNTLFLKEIREQLQSLPMVGNAFLFSDLSAFLLSIDDGRRYDAVLMDIDWDQATSGMDVAAELYKLSPETKIIYVTGYSDRFSQRIFLYRANLSGYLTKPVDMELLQANLKKVASALPSQEAPSIVLRQRGAPVSIPLRDIHFIESRGHTIEAHTVDETIIAYGRLEDVFRTMPDGFCQCHRSYIVNMGRIRRFQPGGILLKNGERVPVSRSKYDDTKKAYFNYIGETF
ncbi:MAG: LytTR family DNA-binding domain-containing protein [Clostridiales bacterium]|jgi:DNA-binding LytR/AlgR family response regulator|nr:LytTR family DNA-binding domain-containing protein [Clostridiales bacterium]